MIQVFERYLITGNVTKENLDLLREKKFKVRKMRGNYYIYLHENLEKILK